MEKLNERWDVQAFEEMAQELVSLSFAICEEELAVAKTPPSPPQKALAAAALSVKESVNTFLAITRVPDPPVSEKE